MSCYLLGRFSRARQDRVRKRQFNREPGTLSFNTVTLDRTTVLLNDTVGNR